MSGQLGSLVVEISGNVAKLTEATTKAQYHTKQMADGIAGHVKSIEKGFIALGSVAVATIGAIGAGTLIKKATDEWIAQENAVKQLEQRLKSTGAVVGITSKELQDYASALQKTTTFGDDATIAAEALLLTFTKIRGPVFKDAISSVQDMSIAMDQDLKSSVIQIGKALNDPIKGLTALSRVGVAFTEDQKEMIKRLVESNDVMGAQKIILTELQTEFGGAATAARDTLGGAIQSLQNSSGDLLERIAGGATQNGGLVGAINALTVAFDEFDVTPVVEGIDSIIAEVVRLKMLMDQTFGAKSILDMIGSGVGSALGISEKDSPILATLLGSTEEFERAAAANERARMSYERSDAFLQGMANREVGLDANGNRLEGPRATKGGAVKPPSNGGAGGSSEAAKLQEKWNSTLADLKAKVEAANPSIEAFEKKLITLGREEQKLLDRKGAAKHASEIKAAFDQMKNYAVIDELGSMLDDMWKKSEQQDQAYFKLNSDIDEQIKLLGFLGDEQEIENQLMQIRNQLLSQGRVLMLDEETAIRKKIELTQQLTKQNQVANDLMRGSKKFQDKGFNDTLGGIDALLNDPTSGFTKQDGTIAGIDAAGLGREFGNTKDAYTLRFEQLKDYYKKIDKLRERDLISEQAAAQMKAQLDFDLNSERLQFASDFFSNISSLAESNNKELAAIGKAAAITQATIDGILAVQKALAAYSPPYNYIAAAAVGVTAAANVAKIAGFEEGGYTGDMGRKQVAGVVHGQEFVVNAAATAKNRAALETMNKGGSIGGMNVTIQNYGTSKGFEVEQLSASDVRIIARDEVRSHAPKVIAGEIANPNSTVSKSIDRNTKTQRKRAA